MAARPRLLLSIALVAVSAVVLAACGSDEDVGEIPADTAAEMLAALDDAQAAQEATPPDCDTIANSASTVSNEASQLPESPVRGAVIAAAENLFDLAKECGPSTTGGQGPQDGDEATTTTPAPETTTTEETTTTTTKEKPPAPKPKPQPPGEGNVGNGPPGGTPPGQDGGGPDTGGTGGGTGSD